MAKLRTAVQACLAAALLTCAAAVAIAQDRPGVVIVSERQKAMRDMQVPRGYFLAQGAAEAPDYATVIAQVALVKSNLAVSRADFPPNTKSGGDVEGAHVRARDIVWSEWTQVSAIFDRAGVATDQIKAAAETKDKAALLTAAQALNKACSDCHAKYRE